MNVYFCNINRINEEVDNFVIAKNKIEQPLIDEEKLEKKMSIQEFLNYIDLTNNIFMANAREVLRFKTMNDNNIKDGDTIQLMVFNN
jgi:hypothetical protein